MSDTQVIYLRVSRDVHRAVTDAARADGLSVNDWCRYVLIDAATRQQAERVDKVLQEASE